MLSNPITEAGQSQLVTEVDAAKLLCQSIRTLQKWRVTGYGPAHCVFRGDPATCTDSIRPPIPI